MKAFDHYWSVRAGAHLSPDECAEMLLEEHLDAEQCAEYQESKSFLVTIRGRLGIPQTYRILAYKYQLNVLGPFGFVSCIAPRNHIANHIPVADHALGVLLLVRGRPKHFRHIRKLYGRPAQPPY